jgi:hypothetical protein
MRLIGLFLLLFVFSASHSERCGTLRTLFSTQQPSRHVLLLLGNGIGTRGLAKHCRRHGVTLARLSRGHGGGDYQGCFPGKEITIMGTWPDLMPFTLSTDGHGHGHRVIIRDDLDSIGAVQPIPEWHYSVAIGNSFDGMVRARSYVIVFKCEFWSGAVKFRHN